MIECRAKWASVCVGELWGGRERAALTLELSEQMGDGKGHRLRVMGLLPEKDESSATFGNKEVRLVMRKGVAGGSFFFVPAGCITAETQF